MFSTAVNSEGCIAINQHRYNKKAISTKYTNTNKCTVDSDDRMMRYKTTHDNENRCATATTKVATIATATAEATMTNFTNIAEPTR